LKKNLNNNQTLKLAEFTIENSGDSIIFHDSHGKILKANQSACNLLNYSANELIGLSIKDINPDSSKNRWKKFWKELKSSKTISFEARHRTKNGLLIPTDVTVNYLQLDNQEYAVGFLRNISCRKKIEEEKTAAYEEICKLREKLELENDYLYEEVKDLQSLGNIIGNSFSLQTILKQIEMVAPTDANVLITGESGTGKELFAHEIHQRSPRSFQPMIKVNCASIPRELYESEFFGHVKGAFTGAIKDRIGRFQLADGGTLFLDEVGELPLDLQSKLLRVLQEGTFERVGDEKTIKADVRIIAATNRNLKRDVEKGTFREDLYYRLNVFPIEAPPLRERRGDISLLAWHFLKIAQDKFKRTGFKLSKANLISLESYVWPGNIRELQNIIERAVIISKSGKLIIDLPNSTGDRNTSLSIQNIKLTDKVLTFDEVKQFERGNILKALDSSKWKIFGADGAAALLDIPPTTLTTRIKRLGLKKPPNE